MISQGTLIKLKAYGGEVITRRVVRDMGDVVAVCTEDEYQNAIRQKRDPVTVGFNKKYIKG
jgi:hypothetical protein